MNSFFKRSTQYVATKVPATLMKAVGQVFGSQILFQAMGFGISLISVRALTKAEYAVYTILVAVQGMLSNTSNSGIMTGFKKIGSENWESSKKLAALVKTTLSVRKYLVAVAFLTVGIYAYILLDNQGIGTIEILIFLFAILIIIFPETNMVIFREAILLKGKFLIVQNAALLKQFLRLIPLLALFLFFKGYITVKIILAITIVATWIAHRVLKSKTLKILDFPKAEISQDYRGVLLKYVRLNWHNSMFYAFKEQISIFFLGLFGTSDNLANLGALSRFGLIFLGVSAIMTNIVGPAFSTAKTKPMLLKIIKNTILLLLAVSITTVVVGYLFADQMLWVLGDEYSGLRYELILILVLSLINVSFASIMALNNARGWIRFSPKFEIPVNIISIVIGAFIFDISTVAGTIYLGMLASAATLLLYIANLVFGLRHSPNIN